MDNLTIDLMLVRNEGLHGIIGHVFSDYVIIYIHLVVKFGDNLQQTIGAGLDDRPYGWRVFVRQPLM